MPKQAATGNSGSQAEVQKPKSIVFTLRQGAKSEEVVARVRRKGDEEEIEIGPRFRVSTLRYGPDGPSITLEQTGFAPNAVENGVHAFTIPRTTHKGGNGESRRRQRPYSVAPEMQPFWKKKGWVKKDSDDKIVGYTKGEWDKRTTIEGYRYMVEKALAHHDPTKATWDDIRRYGLANAVQSTYHDRYSLAVAAYPERDFRISDFQPAPKGVWKSPKNRQSGLKEFAEKFKAEGKDLEDATFDDMRRLRFDGLAARLTGKGGMQKVLEQAGIK